MYLIVERGLEAVSMRDIADRAGMSPGHVLYYFDSKDALLFAALRWSEEDLALRRHASIERARSREAAIKRFCEWYLPDDAKDPRWHLWMQVYSRPPRDDTSRRALLDLGEGWIADLAAIVDSTEVAERACSLMDGLALDVLLGLPGRTRARALKIALASLEPALLGLPA